MVGFSKSIALELVSKGITVNVLGLGYFDSGIINQVPEPLQQEITASIPLKRFGRASEIAACIEYLLSAEAAYMTGQVLHLNGGLYS